MKENSRLKQGKWAHVLLDNFSIQNAPKFTLVKVSNTFSVYVSVNTHVVTACDWAIPPTVFLTLVSAAQRSQNTPKTKLRLEISPSRWESPDRRLFWWRGCFNGQEIWWCAMMGTGLKLVINTQAWVRGAAAAGICLNTGNKIGANSTVCQQ